MYLQNIMTGMKKKKPVFNGLDYWSNQLLGRAMRLFVWDTNGTVAQREIESTILLNGSGFVTMDNGVPAIFYGEQCGKPTIYYDQYEDYSIHSPIRSGVLKQNVDGIMIRNNALANSIYPMIQEYAELLTHVDITLKQALVNAREDSIPVAFTDSAIKSIQEHRNALIEGAYKPISDKTMSSVQFVTVPNQPSGTITELIESRQHLIDDFYSDLGVRTRINKKGNLIESEATIGDSKLLLNLNDMLEQRQDACEAINKLFGLNWSVDLAEELQYNEEEGNENVSSENDDPGATEEE